MYAVFGIDVINNVDVLTHDITDDIKRERVMLAARVFEEEADAELYRQEIIDLLNIDSEVADRLVVRPVTIQPQEPLEVVAHVCTDCMVDPDDIPMEDKGTCLYLPALMWSHSPEPQDEADWKDTIGLDADDLSPYERHFFVFNRARLSDEEGYEAIKRYCKGG